MPNLFKRIRGMWETWWGERTLGRLLNHLTEARFDKVWRGKDLVAFYEFVRAEGGPARGFLITLPLTEGGIVWFFYRVLGEDALNLTVESPEIAVPKEEEAGNRDCPPEWKGYPVWRLRVAS